jgi:hypothetical protein
VGTVHGSIDVLSRPRFARSTGGTGNHHYAILGNGLAMKSQLIGDAKRGESAGVNGYNAQ